MLEREQGAAAPARPWWHDRADDLVRLVTDGRPRYVYHLPTVERQARRLLGALPSVDRVYYSMKANSHPRLLEAVASAGLGVECVSAAEVAHARAVLGGGVPLLFTPNYCPLDEYAAALDAAAEVTVDGPEPLQCAPALFRGVDVGARIDPGRGFGHHAKVLTAGAGAKFGHPASEIGVLAGAAAAAGARIVGLHAHVGSGILDPAAWYETGRALLPLLAHLPDVLWVDLGGGLGVVERPGQAPLDLEQVERRLGGLIPELRGAGIRLEPGRYLVSEAGVLVSPVTQVRHKGELRFIGLAAGMNALLRPALYGAWHGIHNLSRLDEPPDGPWNIVGPICEMADVLGTDRVLPTTRPGDVLLIENAGAYGRSMASHYNLREPPAEVVLDH